MKSNKPYWKKELEEVRAKYSSDVYDWNFPNIYEIMLFIVAELHGIELKNEDVMLESLEEKLPDVSIYYQYIEWIADSISRTSKLDDYDSFYYWDDLGVKLDINLKEYLEYMDSSGTNQENITFEELLNRYPKIKNGKHYFHVSYTYQSIGEGENIFGDDYVELRNPALDGLSQSNIETIRDILAKQIEVYRDITIIAISNPRTC